MSWGFEKWLCVPILKAENDFTENHKYDQKCTILNSVLYKSQYVYYVPDIWTVKVGNMRSVGYIVLDP